MTSCYQTKERRRRQVLRALEINERAKLVNLADKICNLRGMAAPPPAGWPLERKREYFEWARQVVDQLRTASARLGHSSTRHTPAGPEPATLAALAGCRGRNCGGARD